MAERNSGIEEQHVANAQRQKKFTEAARKGRAAMPELRLEGEQARCHRVGCGYFCPVSTASGLQWAHLLACPRLPGTLKEALPFLEASVKGWGASVFLFLKETQRECKTRRWVHLLPTCSPLLPHLHLRKWLSILPGAQTRTNKPSLTLFCPHVPASAVDPATEMDAKSDVSKCHRPVQAPS